MAVAFVPWRWAPAVGIVLGLFVMVGFVAAGLNSDVGFGNITGDEGATRMVGSIIQMLGIAVALVAGVRATAAEYAG